MSGLLVALLMCCNTGCAQKPENPGVVVSVYTSWQLTQPQFAQRAGFKEDADAKKELERLYKLYNFNHRGQNETTEVVVETLSDKFPSSMDAGTLMSRREYLVIDHPRSRREVRLMAGIQRVKYASAMGKAKYVHFKVDYSQELPLVLDDQGRPLPGVIYRQHEAILIFDETYDLSGEYHCDAASKAVGQPPVNPDTGRFY